MNQSKEIEERLRELPLCQYEFLPADQVPFSGRVREICKRECSRYGKSWSCPPAVGTWEECQRRALAYRSAFVFSTVAEVEDTENLAEMLATRGDHEAVVRQVRDVFLQVYGTCLTLSSESCDVCQNCAYPEACRHPERMLPCIESYGVVVPLLAEQCGMEFSFGAGTVTWFGLIFFDERMAEGKTL
ncbi:DUF2284 domain-containing protein [Hominifimenecus sp. rT4P-3]|uniref:DUF2284 domain-containing protein n=1 Tax=Hominifimenecus sp. rT4P-3 TaxID=3242979 RepID=UPI003DA3631F